jgi:fumarylacetoacetate (FAA) hydrolase family protein
VRGLDGFELDESCSMTEISRDPLDLVAQVCGVHHSDAPGRGFTHHPGDIVSIDCPRLGTLVNSVHPVADTPPWRTGVRALMQMLHDLRTTPP